MSTVRALVAGACLLFAAHAGAQGCAGFADVVDDGTGPGAFCPSVTWLKNRAITLGCSAVPEYCPDNAVTRLQMAAFMFRLGNALAPQPFQSQESGPARSLDAPTIVCEIVDVTTSHPRAYVLSGHVTAKGSPDGDVRVMPVRSVNGGPFVQQNTVGRPFSLRTPVWNGTSVIGASATSGSGGPGGLLLPGSTYRFALRIERDGGSADIGSFQCHLIVELRPGLGSDP